MSSPSEARLPRRALLIGAAATAAVLTEAASASAEPGRHGRTCTTHYIDPAGDDTADGLSPGTAWQSFTNVDALVLAPGDTILLKRGGTWDRTLALTGSGSADAPIRIGAYGSGPRPHIQLDAAVTSRCITITNTSFLELESIEVSQAGAGIVIYCTDGLEHESITIDDVLAHDFRGLGTAATVQSDRVSWSYGIGVTGSCEAEHDQDRALTGLTITNTEVHSTGAGIALDWGNHTNLDGTTALAGKFGDVELDNVHLHDNTVEPRSFTSLFVSSVIGFRMRNSLIDRGAGYSPTGTAPIQLMYTRGVRLENVTVSNTPYSAAPDNAAIDFECDTEDTLITGCSFVDNAGPAIEFLATPGFDNPYSRDVRIEDCTFTGNDWALKQGGFQIAVVDWKMGNAPTGSVTSNSFTNAPQTRFFGGFGDTSGMASSGNVEVGVPSPPPSPVDTVQEWTFETDTSGWTAGGSISGFSAAGGSLTGDVTGIDPYFRSADSLAIPIGPDVLLRLRMAYTGAARYGQLYFITDDSTAWNEEKHLDFAIQGDGQFHDIDLVVPEVKGWTGTLRRLRIDPSQNAATGSFQIESIALMTYDPTL